MVLHPFDETGVERDEAASSATSRCRTPSSRCCARRWSEIPTPRPWWRSTFDDDGFTYIVDRAKDMINRGGENVYCVEVENALAAAPGVFEIAVIGVPDPMMGEKVGAVVVPTPGTEFDVQAFLSHAREHLADFKVPQFVAVRSAVLPRNPGGKVLKPQLRADTEWTPVEGT